MARKTSKKISKRGNSLKGDRKDIKDKSFEVDKTACERDAWKGNHNDPSWYKTNEQLAKDTASIPFGYSLGSRIDFGSYGDLCNDYAVPGIMRLNYVPTYGSMTNYTSPINIATRNIYTFLKSVNSRAKTYDAPDLGLYLIAMDNAIAFHNWMKRLYGLMNTASYTNRYYAEAAVRAAGGNYSNLLMTINDFRAYINRFALRISTLPIPSEFSIFARHSWLTSHAWYDSENPSKAQSYIFNPVGFYVYGLDQDQAGSCTLKGVDGFEVADTHQTREYGFADIKKFGESILSSILYGAGEEDFNIIGGDILYAYGENRLYRATTITEDYAVIPQYNSWVCDQINNAKFYGVLDTNSTTIKQDATKSYLQCTPTITFDVVSVSAVNSDGTPANAKYPWNAYVRHQYVNIFDQDTSSDHVMVATRLLNIPNHIELENDKRMLEFDSCASEIGTTMVVYYYATATGNAKDWQLFKSPVYKSQIIAHEVTLDMDTTVASGIQLDQVSTAVRNASRVAKGVANSVSEMSSFDRKPIINVTPVLWTGVKDPTKNEINWQVSTDEAHGPIVDLNNYTVISRETLKHMNEDIMLAMFGIDEFGKQVSLK